MSMSKQDFIALADRVRDFGVVEHESPLPLTRTQVAMLADFCASQNPRFNRQRWLDYIAGKCGPNGGKVKP